MITSQPTFETFVRTRTTAEAYRWSRVVSDTAPRGVLLLSGGPGTGKTHLLRAIAHAAGGWVPPGAMLLTTARTLRDQIVRLVLADAKDLLGAHEERRLLLIDDLQDLATTPAAEKEVAARLARLVKAGASVVCASGVPLEKLPELTAVLSAETSYRAIELKPLPLQEVQTVVRHFARQRGLALSKTTVAQVSERCGGDLRRAFGIVVQLDAAVRWATSSAAGQAVKRLGAA